MSGRTVARVVVLFTLAAVVPSRAGAATYSSPLGFRIDYPAGWEVSSGTQREAIKEATQSMMENVDVDAEQMKVIMLNPEPDGFAESINVVISLGRIPADEPTAAELLPAIKQVYAKMGVRISNTERRVAKFGRNRAISLRYDAVFPGSDAVLRLWQVHMPRGSRTFIVTCTALADEFPGFEPLFEKALNSVRLDTGVAGAFLGLPGWARNVIVAAVIGAIAGGLGAFLKVRKKAAQGE